MDQTITGEYVKIDAAIELVDELRFEYQQLVYESEDLEFSDRSEDEILQQMKSVKNQLRKIEWAFLDEFILREVRTIVSEILSTRTRLHTLLLGIYTGVISGERSSDNVRNFLARLKEDIEIMINYKSETLIPFMDRHGMSLRTFLREFNNTKLSILFNSPVPYIQLKDHSVKRNKPLSAKGEVKNVQKHEPKTFEAPLNLIVTALHKTFEDLERLIATRMLAAEEMDNEAWTALMDELSDCLNTTINDFISVLVNELEPFCAHHGVNTRQLINEFFDQIAAFE